MNSSHLSKGKILDLMKDAIREQSSPPGQASFEKLYGVGPNQVARYWPRHSDLVCEAGGTPNPPKRKIPRDELFRDYAKVCRHLGKIPTLKELRITTRELGTRTSKLQSHFGSLAAANDYFSQWLRATGSEYAEILNFPGWGRKSFDSGTRSRTPVSKGISPIVVDRYPFLPAGLLDLNILASNRLPSECSRDASASLIFEEKCASAFRSLGFQVRPLGQGKGRNPDCLAFARPERFGVVIDAKARAEGFVLGTEDRKFLDYSKTHSENLRREGIERIYLCVVSSSFRDKDVERFRRALTGSGIHGWSLWPAEVLMATVERSIAQRSDFRLGDLEEKFFSNDIVTK